jgi:adenine-specific DNA-methyltransferase
MVQELDIKKLDGMSLDVAETDKERLKAVFPQCFVEGKLDIDKLLSLCGEYIDNDFEKYKFEWKGKSECLRIAGKRSTGTLRPCPIESVDFENTNNLYIEGDNLEVLKLLQTAYYRKVKMIYIDPPYNTGNDFVYEDDFKDPLAKYKEITSQTTKSNPETMGRYHTNWLNMMYPRLRLAANLLRDDGVIFISIDDNEVDNLKKICNEVFGEENFRSAIIIRRGAKNLQAQFDSIDKLNSGYEYVLMYSKMSETRFNKIYKEDESVENPVGGWNNHWRGTDRPTMRYDILGITPEKGQWRWAKERSYEAISNYKNMLSELGKENPTQEEIDTWYMNKIAKTGVDKIDLLRLSNTGKPEHYIAPSNKKLLNDLWDDIKPNGSVYTTQLFNSNLFSNPKSVDLLNRLLEFVTQDDDIVLDFFSGSATTAHAVMRLNAEDGGKRQFIMVQLPELTDEKSEAFKAGYKNICEIGKERIRRAGAKIKEQNADVDVGFKVLKLDTSNLVKWDDTPLASTDTADLFNRMDGMIESIKKGRSELDVVYEVMLKLGIPATYQVFENNLNGRKVYSIGDDGLILICLDGSNGGITPEDVTAMCEFSPAKIVAAEEAFKDDVALSNAFYISKDSGVEIMLL